MSNLDLLLKRNEELAAPTPMLPQSLQTLKAVIIGCADMRVDPSHVLGIELGEAVVMRNIGGRVTPAIRGSDTLCGTSVTIVRQCVVGEPKKSATEWIEQLARGTPDQA